MPAKKKEALLKAIDYAKKALNKDNNYKNAWRVKAKAFIELDKIDGVNKDKLLTELNNAINNGCRDTEFKLRLLEIDCELIAVYREDLDNFLKSGNNTPKNALNKARAYRLLCQIADKSETIKLKDNLKSTFQSLINSLYVTNNRFSDPIWDAMIQLLKDLREDENDCWKPLSLKTLELCQTIEEKTTLSLHIRWYWSRQRDLYDLAFIAAETTMEKAKIADSLKSRPSLKWSAWEHLGNKDECYKKILEAEAMNATGVYILKFEEDLKEKCGKNKQRPVNQRAIDDIPSGWIVIHFYLNQLEEQGYALIYDSCTTLWQERKFKYNKLFNAYLAWQENYNNMPEDLTDYQNSIAPVANFLKSLCEKIGHEMPFLFDVNLVLENKPVLLIPHDFLHRLPIHGALENNARFFFNKQREGVCYLPSLSQYIPNNNKLTKTNICLINNETINEEYIDDFPQIRESCQIINNSIASEQLKNLSAPQFLAILCIGQADAVSPFNSRLMLGNAGVSYFDIIQSKTDLSGSMIFIGACEADLVFPIPTPLDEHLSISAAFLNKKAKEIIGAMWKIDEIFPLEFLEHCCQGISTDDTLTSVLNTFQKRCEIKNVSSLYKYLSLRIFGAV